MKTLIRARTGVQLLLVLQCIQIFGWIYDRRRGRSVEQALPLQEQVVPLQDLRNRGRPPSFMIRRNTTKPTLVLDIGPHKTGSTWRQCMLSRVSTQPHLEADGYDYLGTVTPSCGVPTIEPRGLYLAHPEHFIEEVSIGEQDETIELTDRFQHYLSASLQAGHHAMVTAEHLSKLTVEEASALYTLLSRDWDVHVVRYHRRFYDRAPSQYSQLCHKTVGGKNRDLYADWPGQQHASGIVSQPRLPFDLDVNRTTCRHWNGIVAHAEQGYTTSHGGKQLYDTFAVVPASNMHVINLHELEDLPGADALTVAFFCSLPHLAHSCRAAKDGKLGVYEESKGTNPSFPVNYDILAVQAYDSGLLQHSNLTRIEVFEVIRHQQENVLNRTSHDFALSCLSQDKLDRLLTMTLAIVRREYPHRNFSDASVLDDYREDFAQRVTAKKYCSIDATATLHDPAWINFFRSL